MSALYSAKAVGEKRMNMHMGRLPAGQPCGAVWGLGWDRAPGSHSPGLCGAGSAPPLLC